MMSPFNCVERPVYHKTGTRETLAFVERWLPVERRRPGVERRRPGGSILEVGCGDGELAAALQSRGYRVLAIDADATAVAAAREREVDAHHASWPDFEPRAADAVLFTRSLHHIDDLDGAVERARECAPLLLVEDFAFTEADPRLIEWIRGELAQIGVPWDETPHDIHSFSGLRDAIARHFDILAMEAVPYCYRYAPEEHAARLIEGERSLGFGLLGRRVAGRGW
jgi:SAM-dependent methyltransferase